MYLFNPDHDLALANYMSSFTSPASARKLRSDLSVLPLWYAPDGAVVIAEGELNNRFLEYIKSKLPINNSLVSFSQLGDYSDFVVNHSFIQILTRYSSMFMTVKRIKYLKCLIQEVEKALCGLKSK